MRGTWWCGVCETVNTANRTCTACGANLTRRATVATNVRNRIAPMPPPPPVRAPLPDPVRRAINREPVHEPGWEELEEESGYTVMPIPGGCLVSLDRGLARTGDGPPITRRTRSQGPRRCSAKS